MVHFDLVAQLTEGVLNIGSINICAITSAHPCRDTPAKRQRAVNISVFSVVSKRTSILTSP